MNARSPCIVALLATGCTVLTHANEYSVSDPDPDDRVCVLCPDRQDLVHPPCPSGEPAPANEGVYYFALRAVDFGIPAPGWPEGYMAGLDQDCSDRPRGMPVTCLPRNPGSVFAPLPGGIDNALATQVLYPLVQAEGVDPQSLVNESLERGMGGVLLVLERWNGTPEDDDVGVRMVNSLGLVSGDGRMNPSWSGDDVWSVFADRWDLAFPDTNVPDARNKGGRAYVANGQLVWDAREIDDFLLVFGAGGALIDVRLASVVFTGRLITDRAPMLLVDGVLAGVWSGFLASRNADHLAEIVSRCDPCQVQSLAPFVEALLHDAPDMLLPTSAGGATCDAISVGLLGSYVQSANVGQILPLSSIPKSCPGVQPCASAAP